MGLFEIFQEVSNITIDIQILLERGKPLSEVELASVIYDSLNGLEYVHSQGVSSIIFLLSKYNRSFIEM